MVVCQTYQLGDREYLEVRDGDRLGGDEFDEENGPTWTLLVDDFPVAIFGSKKPDMVLLFIRNL